MHLLAILQRSNYLGLLTCDLLGVAAHISRTAALGDSRFVCHICVYCQEVKAGRPTLWIMVSRFIDVRIKMCISQNTMAVTALFVVLTGL
jgi:hypothetical protein